MISVSRPQPLSRRHEYQLRSEDARAGMTDLVRLIGLASRMLAELDQRRDRTAYDACRALLNDINKASRDLLLTMPPNPVANRNKTFRIDG